MEEKLLTHTPIFDLVEKKDDGEIGFNPVGVNAPDWVTVIVERGGMLLTVKQLRYGLMKECEEFVCGQCEPNERPVEAVQRELAEETGIVVGQNDIQYLGCFAANPAFMSNHMHYFYVNLDNVLEYIQRAPEPDAHEKLTARWKDFDAVRLACMFGGDSVFMPAAFWLLENKI